MTQSKFRLLKLPGDLFQQENPNSKRLISTLTKFLNDGYDLNKRYNIIQSTRIKNDNMFINDLGFDNPESFFVILLKPTDLSKDASDEYISAALKSHPPIALETKESDFTFDEDFGDQVIGTIGIKVSLKDQRNEGNWELTGFVSRIKGVGKLLINRIFEITRDSGKHQLLASVIYEHGLVSYYSQFGFVEYEDRILQKVDATGRVIGGSLEDGVYATRNFHVAFLKKEF